MEPEQLPLPGFDYNALPEYLNLKWALGVKIIEEEEPEPDDR